MANSPVLATRVNPELHRAVMEYANTNGTSLTETLRELLAQGLASQNQGQAVPQKTKP